MKPEVKIGILIGAIIAVGALVYFAQRDTDTTENINEPEIAQPTPDPQPVEAPPTAPVEPPPVTPEPEPPAETVVTEPDTPPEPEIVEEPDLPVEPEVVEEPDVPVEPDEPEIRYHVVVKGDTLFKIAESYYGHGKFGKAIYEANKNIIKNPNILKVGWKLKIPDPADIKSN